MQFSDFAAESQVFTTRQMLDALGGAPSARVALSRAVKSGRVLKVRTGLYVSQSGRFQGTKPDPVLIASTFATDAVFVYHSALELHGLAHSLSNLVQFASQKGTVEFGFGGARYKGSPRRDDVMTEVLSAKAFGTATVTTREQTLVDCMAHIGAGGGIEEVIRSFAGLPYADIDTVLDCLKRQTGAVAARVGWYLELNQERWAVADEALAQIEALLPPKASYKLDPAQKHFAAYSARWRLSLTAPTGTIKEWMEM